MPGGESIRQVYERVRAFFTELGALHPQTRIVAVTHGGILDALYRFVNRIPLNRPRDFPIYNASLNWVSCEHDRWRIDRWGDISHLTRDAALDDF
jgi:probable phosphoglycerate mutase